MSSAARFTAPAALTAVLVVALSASPAQALPEPRIPADVSAAVGAESLRRAEAWTQATGIDLSRARVDAVHELFMWSTDFVNGKPTAEPVTSSGSWVAAVMSGDRAVGLVWVGRPDGGPAELVGIGGGPDLADALTGVAPSEILIEDAPAGAWYALEGNTVRPLNDWARGAQPEPAELSAVQVIVAEQTAARLAVDTPPVQAPVPVIGLSLGAMAAALAVAGGLLVRRRRRTHPSGGTVED
jgi:hypothetical protein